MQGFGAAIATLSRGFDETSLAKMVATENGLDLKDFISAKCDDFDLKEIRRLFKIG